MADNHDTLMREVEDELRREKFEALFKTYGSYVVAAGLAVVLGVGGFKYWQSSVRSAAESAGASYQDAVVLVEDDKSDDAAKAFAALAENAPDGYAGLARLRLAAVHVNAGKKKEAVAVFEDVAKASNVDPLLKDFAKLQAASLRVGEADWTEMKNRLNALSDDTSPWRYSARELLALAAVNAGKTDEALKTYEALLADRDLPASLGERAKYMVARLSVGDSDEKSDDGAKTPKSSDASSEAAPGASEKPNN